MAGHYKSNYWFLCIWDWVQWIRKTMLIQLHKNGGILLSHLTDTFKSLMRWIDTRALILLLMPKSVLWSLEMVIERPDGMLTIRCLRSIPLKAGFRRSFNDHDCSGTASQITPQGRHQHANASGGKVEIELATVSPTDSIQFYVMWSVQIPPSIRPDFFWEGLNPIFS